MGLMARIWFSSIYRAEHELWGERRGVEMVKINHDWLTLHRFSGVLKKVEASPTLICSSSCSDCVRGQFVASCCRFHRKLLVTNYFVAGSLNTALDVQGCTLDYNA